MPVKKKATAQQPPKKEIILCTDVISPPETLPLGRTQMLTNRGKVNLSPLELAARQTEKKPNQQTVLSASSSVPPDDKNTSHMP